MCYTIFVSTTSSEDLSNLPTTQYRFECPDEENDAKPLKLLKHPFKWYLSGRYGGCSCHYRHLMEESIKLGFGPPEEWFPEDEEYIEATSAVYDVFARIIAEGSQLDVLDIWSGADPKMVKSIIISLAEVPRNSFRFFENHHFELTT